MVNLMMIPLTYANPTHTDIRMTKEELLKQEAFFLFLANSVEQDGEITTALDLESINFKSLEVEPHTPENTESKPLIKTQEAQ